MPNPYFKFKQFTVYHDKCAMKVGTDGVLLGAWSDVDDAQNILDIGSGSGLVALMLAQRSNAQIEAIDISHNAFVQSTENFSASPWSKRLKAINSSLKDFTSAYAGGKYNLIVSNPPYFDKAAKPAQIERALARHSVEMDMQQLITCSASLLADRGKLCLILPVEQLAPVKSIAAQHNLGISRLTKVYPKPDKPVKRYLVQLERNANETIENDLVIEVGKTHEYSPEFKAMLKDFYLIF